MMRHYGYVHTCTDMYDMYCTFVLVLVHTEYIPCVLSKSRSAPYVVLLECGRVWLSFSSDNIS